ncbi:MAG TPA: NAD(P)H-binding protein [Solirubrobacteraceae bacterium]
MSTTKKIAVAGATGRVGRHLVDILEAQGHEVAAISRSRGVDVITGEGLAEALVGAEAIVDAATGPSPDEHAATEFFTTATRNLQHEGQRAGVQRVVVVSIIGSDRFPGGYGAAKIAHEQAAFAGPIPARVLRAAQFHEFVSQLMEWGARGEVTYVPRMRTQLVAARTVAEALADLATASNGAASAAPILEIAGPREERLVEMATLLAARRGDAARVEEATDPADPAQTVYASGALLPGPGAILAGPTFEAWLDEAVEA